MWFFKKISNTDKYKTKDSNKIRTERGEVTTDTPEIYNFLRLTQEETENLSRPITRNKIERVIKKNFQQTKLEDQVAYLKKS